MSRTSGSSSTTRIMRPLSDIDGPRPETAGRWVAGLRAGACNGVVDALEGGVELGGLLAAGLGQIRAPAAAAADGTGHLLHELAGLEALGQILRDRRHQVDLVVHHAA